LPLSPRTPRSTLFPYTTLFRSPVNRARCPVHSNHRDGQGRVDGNYGSLPHYEPNSFGQWQQQPQYKEPPLKINGDADFWDYREEDRKSTRLNSSHVSISYAVFC